MPRIGKRPTYQKHHQIVNELLESGCSTVSELVLKSGLSRSVIYRVLSEDGLQLQRKRRSADCRSYILKEVDLSIPTDWAICFRGFFYGEGYINIQDASQNWRPIMTINLRADDEAILKDIQSHLGGSLAFRLRFFADGDGHSQWRWTASGWSTIKAILEQCGFVGDVLFPCKKCQDIEIVYQAILVRIRMPYHPSQEDKAILQAAHDDLIQVRLFKSG